MHCSKQLPDKQMTDSTLTHIYSETFAYSLQRHLARQLLATSREAASSTTDARGVAEAGMGLNIDVHYDWWREPDQRAAMQHCLFSLFQPSASGYFVAAPALKPLEQA